MERDGVGAGVQALLSERLAQCHDLVLELTRGLLRAPQRTAGPLRRPPARFATARGVWLGSRPVSAAKAGACAGRVVSAVPLALAVLLLGTGVTGATPGDIYAKGVSWCASTYPGHDTLEGFGP